jgi:hypothetical protein
MIDTSRARRIFAGTAASVFAVAAAAAMAAGATAGAAPVTAAGVTSPAMASAGARHASAGHAIQAQVSGLAIRADGKFIPGCRAILPRSAAARQAVAGRGAGYVLAASHQGASARPRCFHRVKEV